MTRNGSEQIGVPNERGYEQQQQQQQQQQHAVFDPSNTNNGSHPNSNELRCQRNRSNSVTSGTNHYLTDKRKGSKPFTYNIRMQGNLHTTTNEKKTFRRGHQYYERLVSKLDMFPKVERDFLTTPTNRGGIITMWKVFVVLLLISADVRNFNQHNQSIKEHVTVHTDRRVDQAVLHIDMNISFPSAPCHEIVAEAIDISGDSTLLNELQRTHLTNNGNSNVNVAGGRRSAPPPSSQSGCNLSGKVKVNRVGGIFYFHAPVIGTNWMGVDAVAGESTATTMLQQGMDLVEKKLVHFNASHCIHKMSFDGGSSYDFNSAYDKLYPNSKLRIDRLKGTGDDLAGIRRIQTKGEDTGLFFYFLQLVPTSYRGEDLVDKLLRLEHGSTTLSQSRQKRMFVAPASSKSRSRSSSTVVTKPEPTLDTIRYTFTHKFEPLVVPKNDILMIDPTAKQITNYKDDNDKDKNAYTHENNDREKQPSKQKGEDESNQEEINITLPGVYVQYELFQFSIEVATNQRTPFTHLLLRMVATVGASWC